MSEYERVELGCDTSPEEEKQRTAENESREERNDERK